MQERSPGHADAAPCDMLRNTGQDIIRVRGRSLPAVTGDELHAILNRAANAIGPEVDYFPWALDQLELDRYGWCSLGWVHCRRTHKAYTVWWHEKNESGTAEGVTIAMPVSNDRPIPLGYCHCGCGQRTNLIAFTDPTRGLVAGQPRMYLRNHNKRNRRTSYMQAVREAIHPHTESRPALLFDSLLKCSRGVCSWRSDSGRRLTGEVRMSAGRGRRRRTETAMA